MTPHFLPVSLMMTARAVVLIASAGWSLAAQAAFYVDGGPLLLDLRAAEHVEAGKGSLKDYTGAQFVSGYIAAIADLGDGAAHCVPAGTTAAELRSAVETYLMRHPRDWEQAAPTLVRAALAAAYLCGNGK